MSHTQGELLLPHTQGELCTHQVEELRLQVRDELSLQMREMRLELAEVRAQVKEVENKFKMKEDELEVKLMEFEKKESVMMENIEELKELRTFP